MTYGKRDVIRGAAAALLVWLVAAPQPGLTGGLGATVPVAVSSTGTSPLQSCTADNASGQSGTFYAGSEVEGHLAVNPVASNNVVAAWQQDRWNNGGARGVVVGTSLDRGRTWTEVSDTRTSLCTGGTPDNGGDYQRATDPWISFAANGDVYLMTLSIDNSQGDGNPDAMLVTKSTDGGRNWSDPQTLIRDEDPAVLNDKNTITADPNHPLFVYAVWSRFEADGTSDTYFTRTLDGGATWEQPRAIFDPGPTNWLNGNQIVVLPQGGGHSGALVNLFTRQTQQGHRLQLIRSTDNGVTWSAPIEVADNRWIETTDPLTGIQPGIRGNRFLPDIAVDPASGNLYVVWSDGRFSNGNYNHVAFAMSTDGGLTWSTPVRVNRTPPVADIDNRQAFTPAVHVARGGTVGIGYYDFRNNKEDFVTTDPLETDHFVVHCHRPDPSARRSCAGAGGWRETRVTRSSFDLRMAPRANGRFLGDYTGLDNMGRRLATLYVASNSARDPATALFSVVRRVHPRKVTLDLARHLVARGELWASGGARRCIAGARVKVQRKFPNAWRTVAGVTTGSGGAYRVRLPDRTGRYRAVAKRKVLDTRDACGYARSPGRRHRHG